MPRVRIEGPGTSLEEVIDLDEREGVVVGRSPSPLPDLQVDRVELRTLASPSISSNHVAITVRDRGLQVRDLGSRNGSWLRLPDNVIVELPADRDTHLRLALSSPSSSKDDPIDPPHYEDARELGAAVATAIRLWFGKQGMNVRIETVRENEAVPTGSITLPLATGEMLLVRAEQTLDGRFHDLMMTVARYINTQNAQHVAEEQTRREGMILASAAIRQVHRRVVDAAMRNVPRIVLLGPSGTGKECLARAYHQHLARGGPLVTVNCATLNGERIVADLFGAEAGAYTGAQRTMLGAVERADGGTLFLDEIGELPLEVQSQLLRFLDKGEYQRLGAIGVSRTSDVCVVAATNRDLRAMVSDGTFRLDLFFRIALDIIEVPSLRERFKDAIAYLATQQLGSTSALDALAPAALDVLRGHAWAGNFRELVNFVQRLPRTATAGSIDEATARRLLSAGSLVPAAAAASVQPESTGDWTEWLRASADAYGAEHGKGPTTWGDMSAFIEQFLKPYALVHMAGVADAPSVDAIQVPRIADTLKADRGTVMKQLRRFFDSRR